jgi:hypothetical protein
MRGTVVKQILKFNFGYIVADKTAPNTSILLYGANAAPDKDLFELHVTYDELQEGLDYTRLIVQYLFG